MKKPLLIPAFLVCLLLSVSARAQLTGTLSVPSATYPDLATAITALNTQGVGLNGVTINIAAGNPQTAPVGGYVLGSALLNATLSATYPITIQGHGNMVTANVGTGLTDGIFKITGADYVMIDSLNLQESATNTTATTQMEWGYALVKLQNTLPYDGCNHVTINGCNISLGMAATSTGIYMGDNVDTNATFLTGVGATSSDAQSSNVFSNNAITNVVRGIYLYGMSTTTVYDFNNTISGNSINLGGNATSAYGVYMEYDSVITILNNNFTSPSTQTGSEYGVYLNTGTGNVDAENNSFTLSGTGTGTAAGFYEYLHKDTNAVFTFNNNTISNWNFPNTTSGYFYGFYNAGNGVFQTINIVGNTISNITTPATNTGGIYVISNTTGATPNINISGNKITNITKGGVTGPLYAIYTYSSATYGTVNILNNVVSGISSSDNTAGYYLYGIYTSASNGQATNINNNNVNGLTVSGTGTLYGYYLTDASTVNSVNGVGVNIFSNDTLNNVSVTTGILYGIYNVFPTSLIHNNLITTLSATTGTIQSYYNAGGSPTVYNNNINHLGMTGASGTIYGMDFNAVKDTATIYNNTIADYTVGSSYSAPSSLYGIYMPAASSYKVYQNTIKMAPTSSGANFGATGIYYVVGALSVDIRDNIVNVNVAPAGTGYVAAVRKATGTAGVAPANFVSTSGGNIYYTPNATNSYLYAEGAANPLVNAYNLTNDPNFNTSCGLYKTFNVKDPNTFTENNLSAGTAPYSYVPTGTSYAKQNGVTVAAVDATDAAGVARPTPADAGALQFTGTFAAATAPYITYTALPAASYCNAAPTVTATITDANVINTTTGTAPRIYYKKATENNAFGTYPANNNSSFNGWKYVEATSTGSTYTFVLDYSKLTAAVAVGDSITYFAIAQDNAPTPIVGSNVVGYAAGYCPSGVNLTSAAGPVAATPVMNGYKIQAVPSFTTLGLQDTLCNGSGTIISLNTVPSGLSLQWQQDNGTGVFANIAGATTYPYTTPALVNNNNYQAVLSCNSAPVATSASVAVAVNTPMVLSTADAYHCGAGSIALTATSDANAILLWYAAATGGVPLDTGATFNTPVINTTTTYYVAASQGTTTQHVGMTSGGLDGNSASAGLGLIFSAYSPFVLSSVNVYPIGTGSGTITISLEDASSNILQSATATITGTTTVGTPVSVPLNFSVPVGTNMHLYLTGHTGSITGLAFDDYPSHVSFPYTIPGVVSITGGSTTGYYRNFYNWAVSTDCETSRVPVTANVNLNAPAFSITGTQTVCNNSIATLGVTSTLSNFNSYVWSPTTDLYTDAAATIPYTGTSASTVYSKTTTTGSVTYIAQATNSVTSCTSVDSAVASTLPSAVSVIGAPDTICQYGFVRLLLSPDSGYTPNSIQWQSSTDGISYTNINGATDSGYNSVPPNTTPYYRAQIKNSVGGVCLQPGDTVVIQDPTVASFVNGAHCGTGADTLHAIGSGGTTLYWYNSATGGTPVDTGNIFITPSLSATTTYYVSANDDGTIFGGKPTDAGTVISSNQNGGLQFDAYVPFTLTGVYVYPLGYPTPNVTGTITLQLLDQYGALIQTVTENVFGGAAPAVKTFVPLGLSIPAGTGMQLVIIGFTNLSLAENSGVITFPYTVPNIVSVTSGFTSLPAATNYFYLYDWVISSGCTSTRVPVNATINPLPAFTLLPATPSVCSGSPITLSSSATDSDYTYSWTPGALSGDSITVSPTATGSYTATATDTNGCTTTHTLGVTVNPLPVFTILPATPGICIGSSAILSSSAIDSAYTYSWTPGALTGDSITVSPIVPTVYTVTATTIHNCIAKDSVNVTVNPLPTFTIASSASAVCSGSADTLTATTANTGYTYSWTPGSLTGDSVIISPTTPTTYTATATDIHGCVTSDSVHVATNPLPVFTIAPTAPTICIGNSVTLAASSATTGYVYNWTPGNITADSITVSPAVSTPYMATVVDTNNCTATDTVDVTVEALPVATIQNNANTLSSATAYTSYQWLLNGQPITGATNQSYVVTANGAYMLIVTNAGGCTDTSAIYNVTGLGVSNVSTNININVYPNPTSTKIFIVSPISVDVSLSSVDGKILQRINDAKEIDLSSYADGMYLLTIYDKNGTPLKYEKLVKE